MELDGNNVRLTQEEQRITGMKSPFSVAKFPSNYALVSTVYDRVSSQLAGMNEADARHAVLTARLGSLTSVIGEFNIIRDTLRLIQEVENQ